MFKTLHRIYVLGSAVLVAGGLTWLIFRSGMSESVRDWWTVLYNQSDVTVKPVGELSGDVIRVLDGATITLRSPEREIYSIALFGVTAPSFQPNSAQGELSRRSQSRLADLVLSNRVQVTLTWLDPQRRGVGVVHLGETNVNAEMVESGLVHFKRKLIKGLPLLDQFALVRADRRAKEQKLSSLK